MTLQDLGSLGELVAAVATVATLAYLAAQIRQNTNVACATAKQEVLTSHREIIRELLILNPEIENIFVRGLHSLDLLDQAERRRFQNVMVEFMLHAQNALQLREKGVLDDADAEVWVEFALQLLRMPGSVEMWKTQRNMMDPSFAAEIDTRLRKPGPALTDIVPHYQWQESDQP
jgi:hypothetical protein